MVPVLQDEDGKGEALGLQYHHNDYLKLVNRSFGFLGVNINFLQLYG